MLAEPSRESTTDAGGVNAAVARALAARPMCVSCLVKETTLDLASVLNSLRALEANIAVLRAWGDCPVCSQERRNVLSVP
jgi:hypothetical protein